MSSACELPLEIIEAIFWYLDGISFLQVAQVCHTWNVVTKNMKKFWKKVCLKEMNISLIEELMGCQSVDGIGEDRSLWRDAYCKWKSGLIITGTYKQVDVKKDSIRVDDNPISCVKLSGSWVLTGHRSGTIYAWDYASGKQGQVLIQHLLMVNDFVLVDLLNAGPYKGNSSDRELLDLYDHHHVISVSKDPTVICNSLLHDSEGIDHELEVLHYHSCGLDFIRVFGRFVAMSSSDNTILLFEMSYITEPNHHLEVTLLEKIIGPSEVLRTFNFWNYEFNCFCSSGARKTCQISDNDWKTIWPFLQSVNNETPRAVHRSTICGAYLFRDSITFLPTTKAKMLVSTDNVHYQQVPLLPTIPSSVVCMTLYGSILALGTETGQLMLYHVPEVKDLQQWTIENPNYAVTLSEASIVCINIACDRKNPPVIAACTTEYMYVLKWCPQSYVNVHSIPI